MTPKFGIQQFAAREITYKLSYLCAPPECAPRCNGANRAPRHNELQRPAPLSPAPAQRQQRLARRCRCRLALDLPLWRQPRLLLLLPLLCLPLISLRFLRLLVLLLCLLLLLLLAN